uniref:Uncharacterized protein n=1 Tax=Brassica oleracea TaxID=3712 RepID=A0A3P6E8M3_BRAOL|nr:unnamed protein product [Brassica oleracea]
MAVDEKNELPKATQREAKLQKQLDYLQSRVIELHRTREETNPELSSEVQSLKEKLNEHSKQLEQSAEKLNQLRARVCPMPTLETPNSGTDANLPPTASGEGAPGRENTQTYNVEESESEPESDEEAPYGATKAKSHMVTYVEQMFSERLDTMQSMVERLPGAYDSTTDPDDHIAQYRQRMLTVALPRESCEATMSIASFAILSDKFVEQFASSRDLEKTSDSLYEILQHRAKPLGS